MDRNAALAYLPMALAASLSARRAWIEILADNNLVYVFMSLSARRAWIEIGTRRRSWSASRSLSARRAWIEIVP